MKLGGWGFPPTPPTRRQLTQFEAAPWSWQDAQLTMSRRAAGPCTIPCPKPAGCGSSVVLLPGLSALFAWQLWQESIPWQRRQDASSALASTE